MGPRPETVFGVVGGALAALTALTLITAHRPQEAPVEAPNTAIELANAPAGSPDWSRTKKPPPATKTPPKKLATKADGGVGPVPRQCSSYKGNRRTGCMLLLQRGFSISQFSCLNKLWTKESGWNHKAKNRSSGAYGIPQALPANKMSSAGSDWRTNPVTQIQWGLGYIKRRYGSPCSAWSHSQRTNWY